MSDQRFGQEVCRQPVDPWPRGAVLLAAPPQRAPPQVHHVVAEGRQGRAVGRYGVIAEEAAHHLPEPSPQLGDRPLPRDGPAPHQLDLHRLELRPHPVGPGVPPQQELAAPAAAADVGQAEEVGGLRLAEPASCRRHAFSMTPGCPQQSGRTRSGASSPDAASTQTPPVVVPKSGPCRPGSHFRIRRSIRVSPIRCSSCRRHAFSMTNRTSHSWLTRSKNDWMSATASASSRRAVLVPAGSRS